MIELTTSVLFLLSVFYGTATASAKPVESPKDSAVQERDIVDGVALAAPAGNSASVETDVREYFKNTPILAEIAGCESRFRHLGADGEIIRGEVNQGDIGVMQINEDYHADEAAKLGLDLKTLRGNMAFAKWLYEKEGVTPWQSSSECWNKYVAITKK